MSIFQKAKRTRAKLKLAITGPSGSGKTYSALRLATGLGGKIAFIDTESGSASLYSDRFDFDVVELAPPYTVEKFIECINAAVEAKYDVLIIDSISHQWRGEGGILNKKEQLDARGGNSFTNWAKLTPEQERFMGSLLHAPIHTICTMRSKQEYAMVDGGNGKQKIQKLGLAPIQRDGVEYEFTTVLDVAMNHEAEASKDRTGLFVDRMFKIDEQTGKDLKAWLESGDEPAPKAQETEVGAEDSDPEEFIPAFNAFKGKPLKDHKPGDVEGFIEWLDTKAPEKVKNGEAAAFLRTNWSRVKAKRERFSETANDWQNEDFEGDR